MDALFRTAPGHASLPLQEERELLIAARIGSDDAVWMLLLQYRGALQTVAYDVRKRLPKMTDEQIEDLESALILAAIEAIRGFDMDKFIRLSQVLPQKLRDAGLETTTALTIPRGTLNLWFKVWRAGGQDFSEAATLAPTLGMSANTFRAIAHALEFSGSEWVSVPHDGGYSPTADDETYRLAQVALGLLKPAELDVIELFYGFRGDPKSDQDVANIRETSRNSAKQTRLAALTRMRGGLTEAAA